MTMYGSLKHEKSIWLIYALNNYCLISSFETKVNNCRVRVANELGAGNGKGAKFATVVAVMTSIVIGIFFWCLIMIFHNEMALIFSTSEEVLKAVNKLSLLLAFTILLNSVQPILSGLTLLILLS